MKKYDYVNIVLIIIMLAIVPISTAANVEIPALKVGDTMPDFTYKDVFFQKPVSFNKDIKGKSKIIALLYIDTVCADCWAELNLLSDMVKTWKNDLSVYAVQVDKKKENSGSFSDTTYLNARYLEDYDWKLAKSLGFTDTPSLVITDSDGTILFKKSGYVTLIGGKSAQKAADEIKSAVKEAMDKN